MILGGVAVGASIATGLALESVLTPPSRLNSSKEPLKIGSIVALNDHHQPHELTLTVRYNGEEIRNERQRLGTSPDDQSVAFDALPAEAGEYYLDASLDDGQTSRLSPEHYPDYTCAESVVVMVNSDGYLSPFLTGPCQEESATSSSTTTDPT